MSRKRELTDARSMARLHVGALVRVRLLRRVVFRPRHLESCEGCDEPIDWRRPKTAVAVSYLDRKNHFRHSGGCSYAD